MTVVLWPHVLDTGLEFVVLYIHGVISIDKCCSSHKLPPTQVQIFHRQSFIKSWLLDHKTRLRQKVLAELNNRMHPRIILQRLCLSQVIPKRFTAIRRGPYFTIVYYTRLLHTLSSAFQWKSLRLSHHRNSEWKNETFKVTRDCAESQSRPTPER